VNNQQELIYKHLIDEISNGKLNPGSKLPTEVELGAIFGTSRLNAHYAVKSLEEAGLVSRNKRGGSVLKSRPSSFQISQLKSLVATRVCVLNQFPERMHKIHWNERIATPLESELSKHSLELSFKDISRIESVQSYERVLKELSAEGCKALLLVANGSGEGVVVERPELLSEFHEGVFVFDPGQAVWQSFPYNTVSINLFGEGVLAAERLALAHGARRIFALKTEGPTRRWLELRLKGAACALKRVYGEGGSLQLVEHGELSPEKLKEIARLEGAALMATTDEIAALAMDMAQEAGVAIGEGGMKLVSFDNNPRFLDRGITTVAPSLDLIGAKLAKMIVAWAEGESAGESACVKIDSQLLVRRTA